MDQEKQKELVHDFSGSNGRFFTSKLVIFLVIAVVVGLGTGYFLARNNNATPTVTTLKEGEPIPKGAIEGSDDTKTFKDIAEGTLKPGGVDGEGAFHLERPGGESQNVYLTSSVIDLSKYEGRKVKVWGETNKAQKAGWLMDVGRIETLN